MNEDEKEQWQFLYSTMKEEGFHYCFKHYRDFEDIEDNEFHKLRKGYLQSSNELYEYIKAKYLVSKNNL